MLCQQSEEVRVLDAASYAVIKNIAVGRVPRGFSLSAGWRRLFVTNSWDDTLSVIDTQTLEVVATWPVGAEPSSVVEDRAGKQLFVANRISNDVAVLNAQTGVEEKRLVAGRGASYLTLSPDGSRIYVTHVYPNPTPHRTAPESEITVIDAARAVVVDRIPLHGIAGVFHLAISADGRLGVVAELHPKNLVPLAHSGARRGLCRYAHAVRRGCGPSRWRFRWTNWSAMPRGPLAWRLRRTSRASTSPAAARRW